MSGRREYLEPVSSVCEVIERGFGFLALFSEFGFLGLVGLVGFRI